MASKRTVKKIDFVKKLVGRGFTYADATKAYDAFMDTIADGVVNGSPVCLGNVGKLKPLILSPRTVKMGFIRTADGVEKAQSEYYIGSRLQYKLGLYDEFMHSHQIKWFEGQ